MRFNSWGRLVRPFLFVLLAGCAERAGPPNEDDVRSYPFGGDGWGYPVTQPFSVWNAGRGGHHAGLDVGAPCGTPIYAAAAGVVVEARRGDSTRRAGAYLVLRHAVGPDVVYTRYDHLMRIVRRAGRVNAGEVIAHVGRTGRATGCHLHLSIRRCAAPERGYTVGRPSADGYLDPDLWLRATRGSRPEHGHRCP